MDQKSLPIRRRPARAALAVLGESRRFISINRGGGAAVVIFGCGLIGLGFAAFLFYTVSQISLDSTDETQSLAEAKARKQAGGGAAPSAPGGFIDVGSDE